MAIENTRFASLVNTSPKAAFDYLTSENKGESAEVEKARTEAVVHMLKQSEDNLTAKKKAAFLNAHMTVPTIAQTIKGTLKVDAKEEEDKKLNQLVTNTIVELSPNKITELLRSTSLSTQQRSMLYRAVNSNEQTRKRIIVLACKSGLDLTDNFKKYPTDMQVEMLITGKKGGQALYNSKIGTASFKTLSPAQQLAILEHEKFNDPTKPEYKRELWKALKAPEKAAIINQALSEALQLEKQLATANEQLARLKEEKSETIAESSSTDAKAESQPKEKPKETIESLTEKVRELETKAQAKLKFATDSFAALSSKEQRAVLLSGKLNPAEKTKLFSTFTLQQKRDFLKAIAPWPWQKTDMRREFFAGLTPEGQADLCHDLFLDLKNSKDSAADLELINDLFVSLPSAKKGEFLAKLLEKGEAGENQIKSGEVLATQLMNNPNLSYADHLDILSSEQLTDAQLQTLFNSIPNDGYFSDKVFAKDTAAAAFKIGAVALAAGMIFTPAVGVLVGFVLVAAYAIYNLFRLNPNNNHDRKLMLLRDLPEEKAAAAFAGMNPETQASFITDGRLGEERAGALFDAAVTAALASEEPHNAWKLLATIAETNVDLASNYFNNMEAAQKAQAVSYLVTQEKGEYLANDLVNGIQDIDKLTDLYRELEALRNGEDRLNFAAKDAQRVLFNGLGKNLISNGTSEKVELLNKLSLEKQHELIHQSKLEPKEIADLFNDSTLTNKPTLDKGKELFIKMAENKEPVIVAHMQTAPAGVRNAAMVLHESGLTGNGKKLFPALAEQKPEIAAQVLLDDQMTEKDQAKYLNDLAGKNMGALKTVLTKIPEEQRTEMISHIKDERHLMQLRSDENLREYVPAPSPTSYQRFSASLSTLVPGNSSGKKKEIETEMDELKTVESSTSRPEF